MRRDSGFSEFREVFLPLSCIPKRGTKPEPFLISQFLASSSPPNILGCYSGSRSNGSQTRKKGTGSRPCLNLSHRRFGLRAVCLSPFSVRYTSVIRCSNRSNEFTERRRRRTTTPEKAIESLDAPQYRFTLSWLKVEETGDCLKVLVKPSAPDIRHSNRVSILCFRSDRERDPLLVLKLLSASALE
jgi:hypothetical protein